MTIYGTFATAIAKGITEICGTGKMFWAFGGELLAPDLAYWPSCGMTYRASVPFSDERSLDVSSLAKPCGLVLGWLSLTNTETKLYTFDFKWVAVDRGLTLFTDRVSAWGSLGKHIAAYSLIAYRDGEVDHNGTYRCDISMPDEGISVAALTFQVSGVPAAVPAPVPPPVVQLTPLVDAFQSVSNWCYQAYLTVNDWVWPFYALAPIFWQLSQFFVNAAAGFASFQDWLTARMAAIGEVLSWDSIKALVLGWLPDLLPLITWFTGWWNSVTGAIESWWSATRYAVQGWIATATQGLDELRADWGNFWAVTFPTLVSFAWLESWWNSRLLEVQWLIDSGFAAREGLWAGWQQWRDKVAELFADPEKWLQDKLESMLVRFW